VQDVVRGVLGLMDNKDAEGDVFNVGSDEEVTVLDLAHRIRRLCNSDSPIEFVEYEQVYGKSFEDMRRRVPDLRKIRRFTGYRPLVTLDQLLELTIRDHCEQLRIPCPVVAATA
jgi:UDP-glucose 4-epimerase